MSGSTDDTRSTDAPPGADRTIEPVNNGTGGVLSRLLTVVIAAACLVCIYLTATNERVLNVGYRGMLCGRYQTLDPCLGMNSQHKSPYNLSSAVFLPIWFSPFAGLTLHCRWCSVRGRTSVAEGICELADPADDGVVIGIAPNASQTVWPDPDSTAVGAKWCFSHAVNPKLTELSPTFRALSMWLMVAMDCGCLMVIAKGLWFVIARILQNRQTVEVPETCGNVASGYEGQRLSLRIKWSGPLGIGHADEPCVKQIWPLTVLVLGLAVFAPLHTFGSLLALLVLIETGCWVVHGIVSDCDPAMM